MLYDDKTAYESISALDRDSLTVFFYYYVSLRKVEREGGRAISPRVRRGTLKLG